MLERNRAKYHCLSHFLVRFRSDLSQLLERFQTDYRYYSSSNTYDFVPIIAGTDLYAKFSNNYCWYDLIVTEFAPFALYAGTISYELWRV